MSETDQQPYLRHLRSYKDLVTTYEATRAGFIALALEKNRRAVPFVEQARALQEAASKARVPGDLLSIEGIERALLTAAGVSDKARIHLRPEDRKLAIENLIENFLEPAGSKFIEELVFRFLLVRGDSLGGSMRNIVGALAQRKLNDAIIAVLSNAGIVAYKLLSSKERKWVKAAGADAYIGPPLRGLSWISRDQPRTLLYNLTVPLIGNNIDMCLFNLAPDVLTKSKYRHADSYIALGELKGGIDPAGADEHWKTARTALERIREGFAPSGITPHTFFVGAAVEERMAQEIWQQLESGRLANAANLNGSQQLYSIAQWLRNL